jgi:hypothetical protein
MRRPTQDEIYSAYALRASTEEAFIGMCRSTISGLRHYTGAERDAAAHALMRAHEAFRRTMEPCCGRGPSLT